MRTLRTSEAAALLNVSPTTLRSWEQRFGFPRPLRSPGQHRLYVYAEISTLRSALTDGLSISSAISAASDAMGADGHALSPALTAFRADDADRAVERSIALRSVDATIEEVLLPALAEICRRYGPTSAAWAFAAEWAIAWMGRVGRITPVPAQAPGLLIGDATLGSVDPLGPSVHALALCCVRGGARVLKLPVQATVRVSDAVRALDPRAVVLAGTDASDDEVARWAYGVRQATRDVPFLLFHRPTDGTRGLSLPESPMDAHRAIARALGPEAAPAKVARLVVARHAAG